MSRPDFAKEWASSRLTIPTISDPDYALGLAAYLGSQPPTTDDHDYIFNLQDKRSVWLGEQMLLAVGHEWQNDVTYDAFAVVRSPVNGQLYRSLVGGNLGNEPSVSGAQWALGVADSVDTLNAPIATVAAAGTINLTTGAPDTSQLVISGTGVSINRFTVAANRFFIVKMAGASNTLVNSASLVTGRGANIPVVAGDSFLMWSTAANTVEILGFVENPVPRASLAASGWQRLPSRLIIQWSNLIGGGSLADVPVTFPIAFPNACLSVTGAIVNTPTSSEGSLVYALSPGAITNTGFIGRKRYSGPGSFPSEPFNYIAVGY